MFRITHPRLFEYSSREYSALDNAFFTYTIDKDKNILTLDGQITTCRDEFLSKVFSHFYMDDTPLQCALVVPETFTKSNVTVKLAKIKSLWVRKEYTPNFIPEFIVKEAKLPDGTDKILILFTVTIEQYLNEMYFWVLTDDLRYIVTEYSKYNRTDHVHLDPEYNYLIGKIRMVETHTDPIFPRNRAERTATGDAEVPGGKIFSPASFLHTMNVLYCDMSLLLAGIYTFSDFQLLNVVDQYLEIIRNKIKFCGVNIIFPIYDTFHGYAYRTSVTTIAEGWEKHLLEIKEQCELRIFQQKQAGAPAKRSIV